MNRYRALFWLEVEAVDRGSAEVAAARVIKSKKLDATIYKIEEA